MMEFEYLAEIAKTIECIGIERDYNTRLLEASRGYYHYHTWRSSVCEITLTQWSSGIEGMSEYEGDLLGDLAVSFDVIISNSKIKPMPQTIREYFGHQLKQLGSLIGQQLNLLEWYDLLDYMGYDLPKRGELVEAIERDHLIKDGQEG